MEVEVRVVGEVDELVHEIVIVDDLILEFVGGSNEDIISTTYFVGTFLLII